MEDGKKNIWDRIKSVLPKSKVEVPTVETPNVEANYGNNGGLYNYLFSVSYNGEKNLGELGPIKNYSPDYAALRTRSWQLYLESEIAQTVINRNATWLIGKGLKLQAEPSINLLKSEKIDLDAHAFSEEVECRWHVFSKSKLSDFSKMRNLNMMANTAYKNAIIGGDVLVVLRYINGSINVQLIDGAHIQSPIYGTESFPKNLPDGNKIIHGIEMNENGEHVRYWVKTRDLKSISIDAKGSESNLQMAFLVYGMEYRLNNVRGLPLISTVMESLSKLERYKEATVGSAEERQKIAFSIEHDVTSSGENPLQKNLAKAYDINSGTNQLPTTEEGNKLANTVAATTNKQAINMPKGAKLAMHESKAELHFKDFYGVNIDLICAALQIPPNVAMSKYDSNFSASRAALKDWEHTLNVKRQEFAFMFYQPIYNFWLEVQILQNKINAPGYLFAKLKEQNDVLEAYRGARFVGAPVPHIDPLREVNAERKKLGDTGLCLPLTTLEAATEALNGGESDSNMTQYAKELEKSKKLKIVEEVAPPITKNTGEDANP